MVCRLYASLAFLLAIDFEDTERSLVREFDCIGEHDQDLPEPSLVPSDGVWCAIVACELEGDLYRSNLATSVKRNVFMNDL